MTAARHFSGALYAEADAERKAHGSSRWRRPFATIGGAVLVAGLAGVTSANAATVTAASCSPNHVQAAVDSAAEGDVVQIPNGTCAPWSSGININKGIHLRAVTAGSVTLVHAAGAASLISVNRDQTHVVEISGIRFTENTAANENGTFLGVYGPCPVSAGGWKPILIHDNSFTQSASNGPGQSVGVSKAVTIHTVGGVIIFSNTFTRTSYRDPQAIHLNADQCFDSWTSNATWGSADTTGLTNSYIEDNTFSWYQTQALDSDGNARVVVRYNTLTNSAVSSHGPDTSNVGNRHTEYYNNKFSWSGNGDCSAESNPNLDYYIFIRGGSWVITDNTFTDLYSCAWGAKNEVKMMVMQPWRNAGPYACWANGYPVPRQPGRGNNGLDPIYIWANTLANQRGSEPMATPSAYPGNDCGWSGSSQSVDQYLQQGRDFVVNTPRAGYAKYAYPHPARSGNTSGGGGSSSSPQAPANLRIISE